MPEIKILHIVSFSSQDSKYPVDNLMKGTGPWLCSPDDRSGSLRADFQLQKASAIEYIDIGNSSSAMMSIEVGSSTWPSSQSFQPLLPTVVLISPADWRSGKNFKAVRMFKKDNLDKNSVSQKWDRIRVICSNPFRKDTQYGLEFLKLYSQEETKISLDLNPSTAISYEEDKKKFKFMSHSIYKNKPSLEMSSSLRSLENNRMNDGDADALKSPSITEITSPISRAAKLVMAKTHVPNQSDAMKEKKKLEMEGLNFLISLNLSSNDINNLKVSHIREEFELKRNKLLTTREKLIFKNIALDYAAQKLRRIDEEAVDLTKKITFNVSNDISNTSILNDSTKESSMEEFEKFNDSIKNSFLNRPVSAKRIRLREEENISPQSPTGLNRNSLSANDCYISQTPNFKARKRLKSSKHVTSSPNSSNLDVWLSPSSNKDPKSLTPINSNKSAKYKSKEICISDSSSDSDSDCKPLEKVVSNSGFTLGSTPKNKFGIDRSPITNMLECPICTELFPSDKIEEHASQCNFEEEPIPSTGQSIMTALEECPICGAMCDSSALKDHVEECAEQKFT